MMKAQPESANRLNAPQTPTIAMRSGADAFLSGWAPVHGDGREVADAEVVLRAADSRLGELIDYVVATAGVRRFQESNAHSHFESIARSIVYQQLSKQAAATIYGRFTAAVGGVPTPMNVLAAPEGELRNAGLSTGKVRFVRELARAVLSSAVDLEGLDGLDDESIIASLTRLPGVGVWTAQMFLMFRLRRLNVLPTEDVGIQRGMQIAYGLRRPAAPAYIARCGKKWTPYCSIACLYLWAAVDLRVPSSALVSERSPGQSKESRRQATGRGSR